MKTKRKFKPKKTYSTSSERNLKATLAKKVPDGPARDKVPYSTEHGKGYEDYEVEDDLEDSQYPPPSKNPVFRKFWAEGIDSLTSRSNFNPGHLGMFDTYCRLRTELLVLDDFIHTHGYSFLNRTSLWERRQTYPEVAQRSRVIGQIGAYAKMLDLLPAKDKSRGQKKPKTEDDDWS